VQDVQKLIVQLQDNFQDIPSMQSRKRTMVPQSFHGQPVERIVEDRERGSQNLNMGTSKEKVMRVTMNHGFNIDFLHGTEIQEHEHLMLLLRITIYIYISYIGYYIYPKSE
jgi:hypothetical protein